MNALASYLRHLIVTGLLIAIERYKLPIEGAEDAAHAIALFIIGTGTWLLVKYSKPILEKLNLPMLPLLLLSSTLLFLPSCTALSLALRTPYGDITSTPDGQVLIQPAPIQFSK
jgi:hypothetical protein